MSPLATRARLDHPRDPLAPIWTGRDPRRIYGTFVWRLLGSIPAGADETPRERLERAWRGVLERDARDPEATAALLFGGGGMYDAQALALREALLDDLEVEVDAMYRELERIDRFVRRLDAALPRHPPAAQEAP